MLGLGAAGSFTAEAHADSRPFGVLPEGNLRLDSPAEYDSVVTLADGRLLVEGDFARVDGQRVAGPVLLDANGRLLRALEPRCVGQSVVLGRKPCRLTMLALPDGGFVVAGAFDAIDGQPIGGIARFRADATLDTDFRPIFHVSSGQQPALIGARLGHLYFQSDRTHPVRRIALAAPYLGDPSYSVPNPGAVRVLDNQGQLYALTAVDGVVIGVSRRQPSGAVDPNWFAQIPNLAALWHDPVTDGVFLVGRLPQAPNDTIARANPAGGVDPEWRLESVPSDGAAGMTLILAIGGGRILSEHFDGTTRWLASHDAGSGRLIRAVQHPLPSNTAFFPGPDNGWIAAKTRHDASPAFFFGPGTHLRATNQPIRLDRTLSQDPRLDTDIHAIGAAFVARRANDGGLLVGGEFDAVDSMPRKRIARLDPQWRVDQSWQLDAASGPRFPIWWVGQAEDGPILAGEFHSLLLQIATPRPNLLIVASGGTPARNRSQGSSPFTTLISGVHAYGSQLCFWPTGLTPARALWRTRVASLLTLPPFGWAGCEVDVTWGIETSSAPLAISPDGWLYYLELPSPNRTVRRVRTESGALPDPSFSIELPPPVSPWGISVGAFAATREHIYISVFETPTAGGRVLRYLSSNGQIDPTWPTVTRVNAFARIAADEQWLYLWDQVVMSQTGPWDLFRRSAIDGSSSGRLRAIEGTLRHDAGHPPNPDITVIGDGHAIASWRFIQLDGLPRDGFAIVGSVETILVDDFEASP
jgi:hypothetical protein